jgi:competence protein ComEC
MNAHLLIGSTHGRLNVQLPQQHVRSWCVALLLSGTLLGVFVGPVLAQENRTAVVRFLDVSEGDATWITTPDGRTVLIDCGPPNFGEQLVLQLQAAGVQQVDLLALTNTDENVVGGCIGVMRYLRVQGIVWNGLTAEDNAAWRGFVAAAERAGRALSATSPGPQISGWGAGLQLTSLGPANPDGGSSADVSQALLLEYVGYRVLFAGDLHGPGEQRVLSGILAERVPIHVLKVADHGSLDGTSPEFLARIFPTGVDSDYRWAVISNGAGGTSFNPVFDSMTARLMDAGIPQERIYSTATTGEITFTIIVTPDGFSLPYIPKPLP